MTSAFGFDIIKIMEKLNPKKIIKYWQTTAEHDYEVMLYLFECMTPSDKLLEHQIGSIDD